ncbi:MAG: hypothetical protein WCO47_04375 [Methylococcus sp.]|jgi:hypothetical protein
MEFIMLALFLVGAIATVDLSKSKPTMDLTAKKSTSTPRLNNDE